MSESKFVEATGLRIHYLEAGAGEPLLLLHGGLATAEMSWAEAMPGLAGTFHVFAPDTRGHGGTDNPGRSLSYAAMADDVLAFIEALGLERPLIFGFSDGGQAALEFALRYPGKSRALVMGGVVTEASAAYVATLTSWGFTAAGEVDFAAMQQAFGPFFEAIQTSHTVHGPDYWREFVTEISRLWLAGLPRYTDEQLRSIVEPVLVITGDRDDLGATEQAPRLFRLIPKGELCVIPNADHAAAMTPLFWAAVTDFLTRHSAAAQEEVT
jgi:pimeloyl-ACP methyl ester carboxylesterase